MANPLKGEVSFEARGKTWTLLLNSNAQCELEEHTGRGILDLATELESWGPPIDPKSRKPVAETPVEQLARLKRINIRSVRTMLWGALREKHPEIDVKEAGNLIDDMGGPIVAVAKVLEAFALGLPEPPEDGGEARPPKGVRSGRGTGRTS